jgi:hypothetical protein
MGMIQDWRQAMPLHGAQAAEAFKRLQEWCSPWPGSVPGMDTVSRLALRMYYGKTAEQAIVAEYLYRWHLAILPSDQVLGTRRVNAACSVFGAPHTIGM